MTESKWPKEIIVYTDGASRGNPGPAAIGIYITDARGLLVKSIGEPLGIQTNNFAEYTAVVRALTEVKKHGVTNVLVRSDSELLIKQLKGEYKVKSETLRPLFLECQGLIKSLSTVRFEHVRREYNKEADQLANDALDGN